MGNKANKNPKEPYTDMKNKAKEIYSVFFKSGKNFSGRGEVWIVFYIGCKATDHPELCVEESVKKGLNISPQAICSNDMNLYSQNQNSQTNKSCDSNKASTEEKINRNHAESRMMEELKKNTNVANKEVNVHVHFYISYNMCFECSEDLKIFSKDYNVSFDITFVTLFHFGPDSPTECCSSDAACLNEKGLRELHENPKFTFQTFNPDTWMRLQNLLVQWATIGKSTHTKNNFQIVFSADVNRKWSENGQMKARDEEDNETAKNSETRMGDKANKKPKEPYTDMKNKAKHIYSIFFKSGKNFSGQGKVWIVFYIGCKATDHVELCVEESTKKGLNISPQAICSDDMNLYSSQTNKSCDSNKASTEEKINRNHAESRMMEELKKNTNVANKEVNVHVHFYISYNMCFECSEDLKIFSKDYNVSFDITFVTLFHFGPKSRTKCCSSDAACLNEKGLRELHENPKFTFQTFNPDTWMRLQNLLVQWATVGKLTHTKNNFQSVFSADVNEKWSDNGLMKARDEEDKENAEELKRIVTSDAESFDQVAAVSQDSSGENPDSSDVLTLC